MRDQNKFPANYRPIGLTYNFAKILESIIRGYILKHLLEHNVLSTYQHWFLPKKSRFTNLLIAIEAWTDSLDQGIPVCRCSIFRFRKSFWQSSYVTILEKVNACAIRGRLFHWFQSFLTNNRQPVTADGIKSSWTNEWYTPRFRSRTDIISNIQGVFLCLYNFGSP